MQTRCTWPGEDPIYVDYHDTEWGVPEYDSRALWEKLILDGFQAGLSWITILKKRDNFREALRADANTTVRANFQRLEESRVQILWSDNRLCLYGGRRHGQRPHCALHVPRET